MLWELKLKSRKESKERETGGSKDKKKSFSINYISHILPVFLLFLSKNPLVHADYCILIRYTT